MESLNELRWRINSFAGDSLPHQGGFSTKESRSLLPKVDEQGKLRPFYGNTVVFLLDAETDNMVREIQNVLYERCGDMLAERLDEKTFHMTLHDLVNGKPDEALFDRMDDTKNRAWEIIDNDIFPELFNHPILMRPTWVFSMVNTSIVLGLEPVSEEDCVRLLGMYERFHEVAPLAYPYLTPHITLAYYRPVDFDENQLWRLRSVFDQFNAVEREYWNSGIDRRARIELRAERLVYQEFSNMNRYKVVF